MRGRIIAVIVAAALIILGAAVAAVGFSKVGWDFFKLSAVKMREHTHPLDVPIQSIHLDGTTADIHVFRSPDDICYVHSYEQEYMPVWVEVTDGCLQIRQEDNRQWYDHIGFADVSNSRVEIALPEQVYETLRLELTTGDVTISEEFQFRSVTVDLTTGDVNCKVRVTELLDLHATTGDIYAAAGTTEADIAIRVTTGDITVEDTACGTLEIKTTTGDTQLKLCDAQTIRVQAATGDVSGILLSEKEFRIHTTTGDVVAPANGTGGVCEIHTTTGDVKIYIKEAAGN